jgi:hypothetical protein
MRTNYANDAPEMERNTKKALFLCEKRPIDKEKDGISLHNKKIIIIIL